VFAGAATRRKSALIRRFPLLSIRDFRLLLADRILAPASFAFSIVGVSFAVLNVTHGSTTALSYVLAAQIAPSLVFALVGGVIADRVAPQRVIVAGNAMMAIGEGSFGILVLAGHPALWQMVALECLTGTGMALFYPASTALLPRIVPADAMQQASAVSRLAMNGAQMGGSVVAGFCVAGVGPGWALTICGVGMLGTLPLMLSLRVTSGDRSTEESSVLRDLREGWSEFRSHTWLWAIVAQFSVLLMAWYGSFTVLGPAVLRLHLGQHHGAAAWGAMTAAESLGLIAGGLVSLRYTPRRPMLFIVAMGASMSISPLAFALFWPLPLMCAASFAVGVAIETMMVQWTVALARNIPQDRLARVSSYDALGSVMAMPVGAVIAGPIAAWAGVAHTQAAAAGLIIGVSVLTLIPRDVRRFSRSRLTGGAASLPGSSLAGSSLPGSSLPGSSVPGSSLAGSGPEISGPPDEPAPALAGSG
jgi:MFS family permease